MTAPGGPAAGADLAPRRCATLTAGGSFATRRRFTANSFGGPYVTLRTLVARARPYRQRWLIVPAIAVSLTAQGGALIAFELTRPEPIPELTLRFEGEGEGSVLITKVGDVVPLARCTERCRVALPSGTAFSLSAIPADGATFGGFKAYPAPPAPQLVRYLGDPAAACQPGDPAAGTASADPLQCQTSLLADATLVVDFGRVPGRVDVALLGDLDRLVKPAVKEPPRPPTPIELEKLAADKPVEVALVPPEKIPAIPPPPSEAAPPPKPPEPPPPDMVSVEVPDTNEVEEAPDDAKHLSDKNRDVAEETRATDTNLDKASDGKVAASEQSDDTTSAEVGGATALIRQLEKSEPTTDERVRESARTGQEQEAKGAKVGQEGEDGQDGTGERADPGLLAMRDVGGRGSFAERKNGDGRKQGKEGLPGINTPLAFEDYQRIIGKDKVEEEHQLAARKLSMKKGRWERKLEALRSTLENFTPDVRTGNQTALKTRAAPFAVYLARMHRRIHELWGFGFLEFLDGKSSDHPLNDFELWTDLEVAINPDGSIYKVTIAKTSGNLEFDVAAVNTINSAGPYETTPEVIRSVDQRVYLRWGFYRNWRQCGTFNAHPFILSDIPGGIVPVDGAADKPTASATPVTPATRSAAAAPTTSVEDAKAVFAANMWISGYSAAAVDKLVKHSTLPFTIGGQPAAVNRQELVDLYSGVLVESGALQDWQLLTADEYRAKGGPPMTLAEGDLVLLVRATKERFTVVLHPTPSGDFRANQMAR
jgi:hypothetical protein